MYMYLVEQRTEVEVEVVVVGWWTLKGRVDGGHNYSLQLMTVVLLLMMMICIGSVCIGHNMWILLWCLERLRLH